MAKEKTLEEMKEEWALMAADKKLRLSKRISCAVSSGKFQTVSEISEVTGASPSRVKREMDLLSNA